MSHFFKMPWYTVVQSAWDILLRCMSLLFSNVGLLDIQDLQCKHQLASLRPLECSARGAEGNRAFTPISLHIQSVCVHICCCMLRLLSEITALNVDICRSNVGFERGQAGWRVYERMREKGSQGKGVKWGCRWWIVKEITGEREEWRDEVSCSLSIMAVMYRWEISAPLSFSIDSVLFYSSP